MAASSTRAWGDSAGLPSPSFRRFAECLPGVGDVLAGDDATDLCMNFMERSLEDIPWLVGVFGAMAETIDIDYLI